MTVASPCVSICSVDEETGLCRGCFRALDEVANWPYYSEPEKQQVIDAIALRKGKTAIAEAFSLGPV